jgi:hypothetical protein
MNLKRRLHSIEAARVRRRRREIAAMAAEHGLTYDEFTEEAEAFFAMPLEDQLAKVDAIEAELHEAGLSAEGMAEIKETLIRHYRP